MRLSHVLFRLGAAHLFLNTLVGQTMAQTGSTLAPDSVPFRYPTQVFHHADRMGAIGGIAGAVAHDQTLRTYWSELGRFNAEYDRERAALRDRANWTGRIVCADYNATVRYDEPGGTPTSIRMSPALRYPVLSEATGRTLDARSPAGQKLEWDFLNKTRIGTATLCELPSNLRGPTSLGPVTQAQMYGLSPTLFRPTLSAQSLLTPNLFSSPAGPYDPSRYSLGVDYGALGRQSRVWSDRIEARYPSLKR